MVLSKEHVEMFASLLSFFAPKLACEIGAGTTWPDVSKIAGVDEVNVVIAVQVNGKLRATLDIRRQISEDRDKVMEMAIGDERVKKWMTGEPKNIVFVPGKLVNLVI